ncbi:MAG: AbrB family transcriptional regulator [Desulfuromonadales bacterium]|nr:AbrB family transcriptional regulator [Desulfuromonadales bacterium]MBN2791829.1 AbrB family transcriptional regulator [Desulfuromonadales bacterium]
MERILLIVLAGTFGGLLAGKMNLPGGPLVGAMLGTALTAVVIPGSFVIPDHLSTAIQIILGITLGMTFNRSSLELIPRILPLAILGTIALLLVSILLAYGAGRLGIIDTPTALFGLVPGGMSGMSLMAQAEGHRTDIVAMLHTIRIFTLFLIVPLLARVLQILLRQGP